MRMAWFGISGPYKRIYIYIQTDWQTDIHVLLSPLLISYWALFLHKQFSSLFGMPSWCWALLNLALDIHMDFLLSKDQRPMPWALLLNDEYQCGRLFKLLLHVLGFGICRGTWWRIGWGDYSQPEGRGFDSRPSRHVGTLGKSFTCSCLCASAWNSDTVSVL